MAVTFVNAGTYATGAATTITPGFPASIAADDVLIAVLDSNDNNTVTPPAGWTKFAELNTGSGRRLTVAWLRYDGTQVAAAWTKTGTVAFSGRILAFRGVKLTGSPIGTPSTLAKTTASTTVTTTAITVGNTGNAVLMACDLGVDTSTAQLATWICGAASTFSEVADNFTNTASGSGVGAAWGPVTTIGSTGTTRATATTSSVSGSVLVEILADQSTPLVVAGASHAPTVDPVALVVYPKVNGFEGGTPGSSVLVTDAGAGEVPFDAVTINTGTGGVFTVDGADSAYGTKSADISTGSTLVGVYGQFNVDGYGLDHVFRVAFKFSANPALNTDLIQYRDAGGTRHRVRLATDGSLVMVNGSSSIDSTAAVIPLGSWFRIEGRIVVSPTVGTFEIRLFPDQWDPTPLESLLDTAINTGTVEVTQLRVGIPTGAANVASFGIDGVVAAPGPTYIGPPPGAPTTLVVADAAHAPTVDAVTVAQIINLVVASATHAPAADPAPLAQVHNLAVADATHAPTVDAAGITSTTDLAPAAASHAPTVDAVVLAVTVALAVNDATHAAAVDNAGITSSSGLAAADTAHAPTVDAVALTQVHNLTVAQAAHAPTVEAAGITSTTALSVADATHAHAAGAADPLTQVHQLAPASASHGQTADVALITAAAALAVADAIHAPTVDQLVLSQVHNLTVAGATHAAAADLAGVTSTTGIAPAGASHPLTSDVPLLTQVHALTVASATHAPTVEGAGISQTHALSVADAAHALTSDGEALLAQLHRLEVADAAHALEVEGPLLLVELIKPKLTRLRAAGATVPDLDTLAAGVTQLGAAVVGPTRARAAGATLSRVRLTTATLDQ